MISDTLQNMFMFNFVIPDSATTYLFVVKTTDLDSGELLCCYLPLALETRLVFFLYLLTCEAVACLTHVCVLITVLSCSK